MSGAKKTKRASPVEALLAQIEDLIHRYLAAGTPHELEEAWSRRRLAEARRLFEQAFIRRALVEHRGDRQRAAVELGIGYSTLKAKLAGEPEARPRRGVVPSRRRRRRRSQSS